MDTFPDLGALSDQELKDLIQQLTEEEQEVSYRRRIEESGQGVRSAGALLRRNIVAC